MNSFAWESTEANRKISKNLFSLLPQRRHKGILTDKSWSAVMWSSTIIYFGWQDVTYIQTFWSTALTSSHLFSECRQYEMIKLIYTAHGNEIETMPCALSKLSMTSVTIKKADVTWAGSHGKSAQRIKSQSVKENKRESNTSHWEKRYLKTSRYLFNEY